MEGGSESALRSQHSPQQAMNVMLTRVLGLSPSIGIDYRPDRKSRRGFIGTPAAAIGSKNKQPGPLLACSLGGGKLIPSYLVRGQEYVRGLGWRGGLGSSAHCSGDVDYIGHMQNPAFTASTQFLLQALQKQHLGFFGLLVSFGPGFAPAAACTVIFSPT